MENDILAQIDPRTLGNELKRARKQQKMRQEDAAQILKVARTTITAIEGGERRIRPDELIKLARAYNRPVSDFIRQKPVMEPFSNVQFRAPTKKNLVEEEEIEVSISFMEDLCRNYLELEQIVGGNLKKEYPPIYQHIGISLEAEAEALAQKERERLGFGNAPISNIRDVLELEVGIRIFYWPLKPNRLSAMYYYGDEVGACIIINSNMPEERCRWSLAHEYCHFLVDRYQPSIQFVEGYDRTPKSEKFADEFAKFFLLPSSKLLDIVSDIKKQGKIRTSDILILANRFGVSLHAIFLRLEGLGLLKSGSWDKFSRSDFKVRENQQLLGLEGIVGRRDPFPLHYRRLLIEAYDEGLISETSLARYLYKHTDLLAAREEMNSPLSTFEFED
jgi:Zn-dependent peptidase ImmA (M78 family)/transcriptional regulator with XRE-family HTH domain